MMAATRIATDRIRMPARPRMVISGVLLEMGLHPDDFFGQSRQPHLVNARRLATERLIDLGFSPSQIGRYLKRNHTTILNYLPKLREAKRGRYARKIILRLLAPDAREVVKAYATAEGVTPELLVAQWINERAHFEAEAKARVAA